MGPDGVQRLGDRNRNSKMHLAKIFQFDRVAREFSQWRAITEKDRSLAPAWWWQPAFEAAGQHKEMPPLICQRLELPVSSTYAAGADVLIATLADQTSLTWPDEFPRKFKKGEISEPDRLIRIKAEFWCGAWTAKKFDRPAQRAYIERLGLRFKMIGAAFVSN
jgi:hypothetical protein